MLELRILVKFHAQHEQWRQDSGVLVLMCDQTFHTLILFLLV